MRSFRKERKPMFARVARVNGEVRVFEEMPFIVTRNDGTKKKIESINDLLIFFMEGRGATEEEYIGAITILYTVQNRNDFIGWCVRNKEATVQEMLDKCVEMRKASEEKGEIPEKRQKGTIFLVNSMTRNASEVMEDGHLFKLVSVNGVPVKHNVSRENKDGSYNDVGEKYSDKVVRGGTRTVWH